MRTIKTAKQAFQPDENVLSLMETFRLMTNECIRHGLDSGKTSMKELCKLCYPTLKMFAIDSRYKLCAISRAAGILKNYRKLSKRHQVRRPYCSRLMLTTCYGLRVEEGQLLLPSKVRIRLNPHTIRVISQPGIEIRSVTLNAVSLGIAFARSSESLKPTGMIGLDTNLNNITLADTKGNTVSYDLSMISRIRSKTRDTKRKFRRGDSRIRRSLYRKYGAIETARVGWILHNVSSSIVKRAKAFNMAITMENLSNIRKLYAKSGRFGKDYLFKMNCWSYRELQNQIDYKARWEGIPVYYINPRGTSVRCSKCDDRMFVKEGRSLRCPSCGLMIDRDVNAAKNIMKGGLRFSPDGSPGEAMVAEREPRAVTLLRTVDSENSVHV